MKVLRVELSSNLKKAYLQVQVGDVVVVVRASYTLKNGWKIHDKEISDPTREKLVKVIQKALNIRHADGL